MAVTLLQDLDLDRSISFRNLTRTSRNHKGHVLYIHEDQEGQGE